MEATTPQAYRLPVIGGMATPVGVYLTTGSVSGGVGTLVLMVTGLWTLGLQCLSLLLLTGLWRLLSLSPDLVEASLRLPHPMLESLRETLPFTLLALLTFSLTRLSPLAGYHAAEHQVVHAIEKGVPLVPEVVRTLPRVHPRCSTNGVAAVMVTLTSERLLAPFVGEIAAFLLGGALAFFTWRQVGAWLQHHFTTRPATDKELANGLQAAEALLARHREAPHRRANLVQRVWRMGFAQILIGASLGAGILTLTTHFFPEWERRLDILFSFALS